MGSKTSQKEPFEVYEVDRHFTIREASDRLRVSVRVIRNLVKRGRLRALKYSRNLIFLDSDLKKLDENSAVRAKSEAKVDDRVGG